MAAINDITGDAIRSRDSAKYAENWDKITHELPITPIFEVFYCTRCHIKVSTSNKTCPCCGEKETLKEVK